MATRKGIAVVIAAATVGFGSVVAQSQLQERQSPAPREHQPPSIVGTNPGVNFGDPLPGLTAAQLADFAEGLDEFQGEDFLESGLGPGFNNVSCVACHSTPAPGGGSAILETRFGRLVNGVFDPLTGWGGSLLQEFAIDSTAQEFIPAEANVVAKRMTTPLFGAGLIEAIPDGEILINSLLRKPDGVTGRPSVVLDVASGHTRIGRFGWKAQQATLLAFSGDAYLNEIGITSRLFPQENAPNGNYALLAQYDTVLWA